MKTSTALKRIEHAHADAAKLRPDHDPDDVEARARPRVGAVAFVRFGEERPVPRQQSRRSRAVQTFLKAIEHGMAIRTACRLARIAASTAYRWRAEDPAFARAWDQAELAEADLLEDMIFAAAEKDWRAADCLIRRTRKKEAKRHIACCPNCGHNLHGGTKADPNAG